MAQKSGFKVNKIKTEIWLFHRSAQTNLEIMVNGNKIKGKNNMNMPATSV